MQSNYMTMKALLRKYSFQYLRVSDEPIMMLDYLEKAFPQIIESARNPNLLAAAIIYVYAKNTGRAGRNGITAKSLAEYFSVNASSISEKVLNIEHCFIDESESDEGGEEVEFIDKDRFDVNEMYWEFIESKEADNVKKSISILKKIIKKDPDYFDPYITLHEYYLLNGDPENAMDVLERGYKRALKLIMKNGKFPDVLLWGFIENRHIIRMLFNYAMFMWEIEEREQALDLMMSLLKSNPGDNIGARYSIVAILEGVDSQEELEEMFGDGEYLDWERQEKWFYEKVKKYQKELGWWFDLEEEE